LAADDLACEDAAPRGRAVSTQLSCDLRFPLGPRTTAVAVLRSMQSTRYASTGHAGCQAAGIHTAQEPPMRPAGAGLRRLQPGRLPHEHPRRRQSEDRLRPHPRSGRAAPEQGSTHAGRKRLTPNKLGGKYIAGLIYRPSEVPDIFSLPEFLSLARRRIRNILRRGTTRDAHVQSLYLGTVTKVGRRRLRLVRRDRVRINRRSLGCSTHPPP
jgi:hypothetical protein